MVRPKQLANPQCGQLTADFLNLAYKDYLAARVLLNSQLPIQGAVLASTAIEKYFKAILAFRGNKSRGHLKKAHFEAVKNFDARLCRLLNAEFITLLQRAYSLRYTDDLPKNFNLVIASREFLAELDYTAVMIQESFHLRQDAKNVVLAYQEGRDSRDERLIHNNYVLLDNQKQQFISAEPQFVYEIRNCPLRGLLEITYFAIPTQSDGQFTRAGFAMKDALGMQYQMAFLPVPPNAA